MSGSRNKKKPLIGLSTYATGSYQTAIAKIGCRHVMLDEYTPMRILDDCDGVIIPGGLDVDPRWYKQPRHKRTQMSRPQRDALEIAMINRAWANNQPLLGICRGHQLLNVARGGTLIQDLDKHPVGLTHYIEFDPAVPEFQFIHENKLMVNSLHHQAIDALGDGLVAAAWCPDDLTIEAVVAPEKEFVVGVQFHPEMSPTPRFRRAMDHLLDTFARGMFTDRVPLI